MWEWYRRATDAIAQGALTNSKRVECLVKGVTPSHIKSCTGPFVFDTDNKKYLDFICGLGTNLFGYKDPHIIKAINEQLETGWLASLPFELEVEAAEAIKSEFQFIDKVRFLKEGTTACQSAIRIARAHTGRTKVLSSGYHGHSDMFISLTPPAVGVPDDRNIEAFTDFKQIRSDVAAVIIEPVLLEYNKARVEWLIELKRKCEINGVVLIFDEIITGFRFLKRAVALESGVFPDILLLGKACAAGMPLSIIGLKRGIGEGKEWFVSGSYHGEALSLRVLLKTMELLRNKYKINDLWEKGEDFQLAFNQILPDKLKIKGYGTRGAFEGDLTTKGLFWQEAIRAGILFGPSFFLNFAHIPHLAGVLDFAKDILPKIERGDVKLIGELPASPFSQRARS